MYDLPDPTNRTRDAELEEVVALLALFGHRFDVGEAWDGYVELTGDGALNGGPIPEAPFDELLYAAVVPGW